MKPVYSRPNRALRFILLVFTLALLGSALQQALQHP
jgi:hypothetical protein